MTGNTQLNRDEASADKLKLCVNLGKNDLQDSDQLINQATTDIYQATMTTSSNQPDSTKEVTNTNDNYWQMMYEALKRDYDHLLSLNQKFEEKLLNVVEACEKEKEKLVATAEYEKTTLMADVNKLSTKLVDARMKLHDREEKDVLHAAECTAPCHNKSTSSQVIPIVPTTQRSNSKNHRLDQQQIINDPNLV